MELETSGQNRERRQGRIAAVLTACLPISEARLPFAAIHSEKPRPTIPGYSPEGVGVELNRLGGALASPAKRSGKRIF